MILLIFMCLSILLVNTGMLSYCIIVCIYVLCIYYMCTLKLCTNFHVWDVCITTGPSL